MIDSKKLEKSKGVVLFAFNTKNINYVKIANQTGKLIQKFLNLPITLITDSPDQASDFFDNIILYEKHLSKKENTRIGYNKNITTWNNLDRFSAFDVSPYDQTLVLDVDCLILSDNLLKLFDSVVDYKILKTCHDQENIIATRTTSQLNHVWATCILFNKTDKSKFLFRLVDKIQSNYNYYKNLFYMAESNFRNDYAFAIADHILHGYSSSKETAIPWSLFTLPKKIIQFELFENELIKVLVENQKPIVVSLQDMHILDKSVLVTESFENFVTTIYEKR